MRKPLNCLATLACVVVAAGSAVAQIATDGTLGRTPRMLHGPHYEIGAGLGRQAGRNLFHSFERFSLPAGQEATFSAPVEAEVRRVISRVTGGERSVIDGTIRSTIPGADFYFINPAGVAFRSGASLDLKGSFHVSTADELRFADRTFFSAAHPTSSLTVAAPEAFGFIGPEPGSIDFDFSFLPVPSGKVLSIVGGDISIDATTIQALGGAINLAALGGPGEAKLESGDVVADQRGSIRLRGRTAFSTTGDGGGTIRIRAGRFVLAGASSLSANNNGASDSGGGLDIDAGSVEIAGGASISASTSGAGDAGMVKVEADRLIVDGGGTSTRIRSDVSQDASGRGGLVTIDVGELEIRDGGEIRASTFGAGRAGAVVVDASHLLISAEGLQDLEPLTGISSTAEPGSARNGGMVSVTADELELRERGVVRSVTFSRGDAGRVTVSANRARLVGGGQISSSTFGTGDGGDVVVSVRDALDISGQSRFQTDNRLFPPSGVFASTSSVAPDAGRGGSATVTARVMRITDHGEISSESRLSSGRGGELSVAADRLVIDDAGEISTEATGSGPAGAITANADALELGDGGLIHSDAEGGGAAGSVTVTADRLLSDRAEISTESASAGGGEIALRVRDTLVLRDTEVTTSVQGGTGSTAGNITIDPEVLVIDRSKIVANAGALMGRGGQVAIEADSIVVPGANFLALLREDITATGGPAGVDGTIVVNAAEVDLSAGLVVLEGAFLDTAPLPERCGARRDIGASSFTGVGRGGLPPSPDGPLASAYVGAAAGGGAEQAELGARAGAAAGSDVRLAGLSAPCVPWR